MGVTMSNSDYTSMSSMPSYSGMGTAPSSSTSSSSSKPDNSSSKSSGSTSSGSSGSSSSSSSSSKPDNSSSKESGSYGADNTGGSSDSESSNIGRMSNSDYGSMSSMPNYPGTGSSGSGSDTARTSLVQATGGLMPSLNSGSYLAGGGYVPMTTSSNAMAQPLTPTGYFPSTAKQPVYSDALTKEKADAIAAKAAELGMSARDLAAVISYETIGTFNPAIVGGANNNYQGLIQFGPNERATYGVDKDSTFQEQLDAAGEFLTDRGYFDWLDENPNATELEKQTALYSTINAGSPGSTNWTKSDGNNTVSGHVENLFTTDNRYIDPVNAAFPSGPQQVALADIPTPIAAPRESSTPTGGLLAGFSPVGSASAGELVRTSTGYQVPGIVEAVGKNLESMTPQEYAAYQAELARTMQAGDYARMPSLPSYATEDYSRYLQGTPQVYDAGATQSAGPAPTPASTPVEVFREKYLGDPWDGNRTATIQPAAAEKPGLGKQIMAGAIDIGAGLIPGVGTAATIFNTGAALLGKPTIGQRIVSGMGSGTGEIIDTGSSDDSEAWPRKKKSEDEDADPVQSFADTYLRPKLYDGGWQTPAEKWGTAQA